MRPIPSLLKHPSKKLEGRRRGKVDQVSRAAAVGGAKARNEDLTLRHPSGNLAPETFLFSYSPRSLHLFSFSTLQFLFSLSPLHLLSLKRIPDLHYLGRLDEIVDVPMRPLFTLQVAAHPRGEATACAAKINVVARGEGNLALSTCPTTTAQPSHNDGGLTFQCHDQSVGSLIHAEDSTFFSSCSIGPTM